MSLNTVAENLISKVFSNSIPGGATVAVSATYRVRTNDAYDPSTGSRSATETDVSIKVIPKGKSYYTHEGIQKETLNFVCQPFTGFDITNCSKDLLVVGSETYRVISVQQVQMGSTNMIFKIKAGYMTVDSRRVT